jgi:hypothetical protein
MDESELTPSEQLLFQYTSRGEELDLRREALSQHGPGDGPNWPLLGVVRAKVLIALCTDLEPAWQVPAKGVQLRGARIDGDLNLEGAKLLCQLALRDCHFSHPVMRYCQKLWTRFLEDFQAA